MRLVAGGELRFDSLAWLHHSVLWRLGGAWAMTWDFWLIFLFLSIVLPWRGRERMRHFMARPAVSGRERIRLYVSTILFQWLLAAIVAWRALARGLTIDQLGLAKERLASTVLLSLIGATLIAVGHWMNLRRLAGSNHPAGIRLAG